MRIGREAILAALGRVISDEIIKKALTYTDGETLDIAKMTKGFKPTYCDGMVNFLEETVEEAYDSLTDFSHPYHDLLRHAYDYETRYLPLLGNGNKKMGSMKIVPDAYISLIHMFTVNYRNDIASFLIAHGITIQDQYDGNLPDASTIAGATEEARQHWLAMASLSRIHFDNIRYGKEHYKRILEIASQTGNFPTWSTLWPDGISLAMHDTEDAFATCPMQSPLIHHAPGDLVANDGLNSPQRCAGQIALYGSAEANENAIRFSEFVGGSLTETGRYSPAALLVDLGRAASKLSFDDPLFRGALIKAREARDENICPR